MWIWCADSQPPGEDPIKFPIPWKPKRNSEFWAAFWRKGEFVLRRESGSRFHSLGAEKRMKCPRLLCNVAWLTDEYLRIADNEERCKDLGERADRWVKQGNLNLILNSTGSQCSWSSRTDEHVRSGTHNTTRAKQFGCVAAFWPLGQRDLEKAN